MFDAITRFSTEQFEHWALDYPVQIAIFVSHVILSKEIHDILTKNDDDTPIAVPVPPPL